MLYVSIVLSLMLSLILKILHIYFKTLLFFFQLLYVTQIPVQFAINRIKKKRKGFFLQLSAYNTILYTIHDIPRMTICIKMKLNKSDEIFRLGSLLNKVVGKFFCLQLAISINPKPIEDYILEKLHIYPDQVLGYFILRIGSLGGFKLCFCSLNSEPLSILTKYI